MFAPTSKNLQTLPHGQQKQYPRQPTNPFCPYQAGIVVKNCCCDQTSTKY